MSPLALSVVNTGSHYAARKSNFKKMTARQYRAYILGLVTAQAKQERIQFGTRTMSKDVNLAVEEVMQHMGDHLIDVAQDAENEKTSAYIAAVTGIPA